MSELRDEVRRLAEERGWYRQPLPNAEFVDALIDAAFAVVATRIEQLPRHTPVRQEGVFPPVMRERELGAWFRRDDVLAVLGVAPATPEPGEPRTYRTKSGRILTDADIEALADEAQHGYNVEHLEKRRGGQEQQNVTPEKPLRWNPFRWGTRVHHRHDPALYWFRLWHRLTGVRRGCSCSRCFHHPKSPHAPVIAERRRAGERGA